MFYLVTSGMWSTGNESYEGHQGQILSSSCVPSSQLGCLFESILRALPNTGVWATPPGDSDLIRMSVASGMKFLEGSQINSNVQRILKASALKYIFPADMTHSFSVLSLLVLPEITIIFLTKHK